jgi:hypothetical protein
LAVSAAERRFILDNLTRLAEADIRAMWRLAEAQSDVEFAAYVIEAFPEIVGPYYELASQASATFFEEDFPAINQAPVLADSLPDQKLRNSARWALRADGDQAVSRMVGSTQRAVYDADRETTVQNAGRAGMSYVRVARPNACAFCRLLASRAANGETYSAAGVIQKIDPETGKPFKDGRLTTVTYGRRRSNSKQKVGKEYHDFCHCVAQAIPRGVDPMEYLQLNEPEAAELAARWDAEYLDARGKAESEDPRAILSEWRQRPGVEDYVPKPKTTSTPDPLGSLPRKSKDTLFVEREVAKLTGKPEAIALRDSNSVNPGWTAPEKATADTNKRYTDNCTHCVTAYELRRRGYDVEATPSPKVGGRPLDDFMDRWTDADGKKREMKISGYNSSEVDRAVESWGPGSRGWVMVAWEDGGSHIFAVENIGGKPVYLEPQHRMLGNGTAETHFARVKQQLGSVYYMRTDDLIPTAKIIDPADPLVRSSAAGKAARETEALKAEKARQRRQAEKERLKAVTPRWSDVIAQAEEQGQETASFLYGAKAAITKTEKQLAAEEKKQLTASQRVAYRAGIDWYRLWLKNLGK